MALYEMILDNGSEFTIDTDADIDELHKCLLNENGLIKFSAWDGKMMLVRGDSVIALWES